MKRFVAFLVSLAATGMVAAGANAATIRLTEDNPIEVSPDSPWTVSISGDEFPDTTFGGPMTVSWDHTVLDLQSFEVAEAYWPDWRPVDVDGADGNIAFDVASDDFNRGPSFPVAELRYAVIGAAGSFSPIQLCGKTGERCEPRLASDGEDLLMIEPNYVNGSVHVVPLPAAGWLILGALGVLMGARRQRCSSTD